MANDPSVGLNAETGGTITGWDHVLQSLGDIFTTHFGWRVMREHYGSFVPVLLGRSNISREEIALFMSAVATAILQWEPRFHVTSVRMDDATRGGSISLTVEGEYRPRAAYGDNTADGGTRRLIVGAGAGTGSWKVGEA